MCVYIYIYINNTNYYHCYHYYLRERRVRITSESDELSELRRPMEGLRSLAVSSPNFKPHSL